jgi:pimeloyl-ACP methyl ester carboxylesterase
MAFDAATPLDQQLEVVSSESARNGAPNLVSFLEGATATRDWDPGQNLSVIGHSYGTTVASLALAETPAENFIMLGSAGIDASIPDVSHLQVDPDHVWASEAAGDNIADLGRGDIQLGTADANVSMPVDLFASYLAPVAAVLAPPFGGLVAPALWSVDFQHPIDPTDASFGANVFSSEDAVVGGQSLQGSDWHTSSPQITGDLTDTPSDQYGYLDEGTNPLRNAALLSLGITDGVTYPPGGGSTGTGSSGGGGGGGGGGGW